MKSMFWLAVLVFAAAALWTVARIRRNMRERERAAEERAVNLLAVMAAARSGNGTQAPATAAPATPPVPPVPPAASPVAAAGNDLAQQKLLFESAHKAGEAGEPALSVQLYARLLARYPATTLAEPARAAVEAQKKKLNKDR